MTFQQAKSYLLERAQQLRIDLEILAGETRELTVEAFGGTLAEITQATQGGIGLRVVAAGRTGYAYSEELTKEALDWTLAEAQENAGLAAADDGFLPEGSALGNQDLLSEGLSAPVTEKADRALELESGLTDDPRTKQVMLARYTEREIIGSLASTRGVEGGYRNGISGLVASFIMQQGDNLKQGFDLAFEKEFHALDPSKTALEMRQKTGRLLGARQLPTGRYRAYLEPRVVAQLLGILLFPLSGKNLIEGKSRWRERLGEAVAAEVVTLIDDPTLPDGLASRPFDSEGSAAKPVTLIDKGVLRSFLHNSYTARRSGQANTGHASRSYLGTLGVGSSNLYLEPGAGVKLEQGVLVTEIMGLHAGANPISGDLSLQALGLWVEGGEEAYPVENLAVAGNLFSLLTDITAVGETLEWVFFGSSFGCPLLEVGELSFAGAG